MYIYITPKELYIFEACDTTFCRFHHIFAIPAEASSPPTALWGPTTQPRNRYGVNDVRYFFFQRLLSQNSDWKSIFIALPACFLKGQVGPFMSFGDSDFHRAFELKMKDPW